MIATIAPELQKLESIEHSAFYDQKPLWQVRPKADPSFLSTLGLPMQGALQARSPASWRGMMAVNVSRLSRLTTGWDGPRSTAISLQSLYYAAGLVERALSYLDEAIAPYLVPCGDGSVQIEWHEKSGTLELSISPVGEIAVWGRDHSTGAEYEGEDDLAIDLFFRWAPRLASIAKYEAHVPVEKAGTVFQIAA